MIADLMNEACTVATPTTTSDVYGNTTNVAGTPVAAVGYLERKDTVEYLLDRQTTVTKWKAWFPTGTAVGPKAVVVFGGQTFQVDGDPWQVYNPTTKVTHHIECDLVVTT